MTFHVQNSSLTRAGHLDTESLSDSQVNGWLDLCLKCMCAHPEPPHPLPQDYGSALRGLCEDALEGLLFLMLFSLLSAGALATTLCSLPRAWALFPPRSAGERGQGSRGGDRRQYPGPLVGMGQPPDWFPSCFFLCHSPNPHHTSVMTTMTQMMTTLSTLRYLGLKGGLGPGILALREGEIEYCIPESEKWKNKTGPLSLREGWSLRSCGKREESWT